MNQNERTRVEPPDTSKFHNNRCDFPWEQLIPYRGQYIAWSPDGTRILASGATEEETERNLVALGIDPSQVVGEFIYEE